MAVYRNNNYSRNNNSGKDRDKKPIVKVPRQIRPWSSYQSAAIEAAKNYNGNIHIDAKAGSGKTATLVEMTFVIPTTDILCCAFNKKIKEELDLRVKDGCTVKTMHAIGFAAMAFALNGSPIVDENKLLNHIDRFVDPELEYSAELKPSLKKAINFCKFNLAKTASDVENIILDYGIEIENDVISNENFISLVMKIMESCKSQRNVVDYADMIWLPIVLNLPLKKYQYVFIDEAQDLNKCQIEIALRSLKPCGKIISLGDENQAIYSFAGADSNSINNIVKRLNSKRMPLSICYRCPKKVIDLAKTIVPDIECAPNASEGSVNDIDENQIIDMVKPGDVILSRTNAKLVSWCMKLLKNKIPANIVGKDIGEGLLSLVKKSKAKDINELITYVDIWKGKECEKYAAREKDASHIVDKAECIITLAEECGSIEDLKKSIENLFSDKDEKNIVVLSSVHKFKGRENQNIFLLTSTLRSSNQEEKNITYVAFTRSLQNMYLVS